MGYFNQGNNNKIKQLESDLADMATINVKTLGAKGDGVTDDLPIFQNAINLLPATGGVILVPGGKGEVYNFKFNSASTIANPTRVLILEKKNVHIIGVGKPTIKMTGATSAYLNSIVDPYSGSGRDIFTCFSFMRTSDCSVENIKFVGELTPSDTRDYDAPRAKCIGLLGAENTKISKVEGYDIMGNVINATGSDTVIDGTYKACYGIYINNCIAGATLEGGINLMGSTNDAIVTNNKFDGCSLGFESATNNLVLSNNLFQDCEFTGYSLSGTNQNANNNIILNSIKNGVMITAGGFINVTNEFIKGCGEFGIQVYPNLHDVKIANNILYDNNKAAQSSVIYLNGTSAEPILNVFVINNRIDDLVGKALYGVYCYNTDGFDMKDNTIKLVSGTYSIIIGSSSKNGRVEGTKGDKIVSNGSTTNSYSYNNPINLLRYEKNAMPTDGIFKRGDRVVNTQPSPGGYDGWVCTTAGKVNTTPWAVSTAYTVGQEVNANLRVYKCVVAGTSNSVNSPPSHSSGTATDGTVTWEYVSALAVFKGYGLIQT